MINHSSKSAWMLDQRENKALRLRLFLLPYAGGSAAFFREWLKMPHSPIDFYPIELPGHGARFNEKLHINMTTLIDQLLAELLPKLDLPFAFFGHSMGALIAYELACNIFRKLNREPLVLFLSACPSPKNRARRRMLHLLSDHELLNEINRIGGTPRKMMNNQELMELLLPMLRADFTLLETYHSTLEVNLSCQINVFAGTKDEAVSIESLWSWKDASCGLFSLEMFDGDHFFINEHKRGVKNFICNQLALAYHKHKADTEKSSKRKVS